MARRHTKEGFTSSDVIDFGMWGKTNRNACRSPVFAHLRAAAVHRAGVVSPHEFYSRMDHVILAADALHKAREWRITSTKEMA